MLLFTLDVAMCHGDVRGEKYCHIWHKEPLEHFTKLLMWMTGPENIGIDTSIMLIASPQAEQWIFLYPTLFLKCEYMMLSSRMKKYCSPTKILEDF